MAATPSGVTLSAATATPEQLAHIGKLASELVSDGDRVGLGSGRAALSFVRELAARVAAEGLTMYLHSTPLSPTPSPSQECF